MWFFDSILEEAPKAGVTPAPVTKKDEQDGSFLIIDNAVDMDAASIPDTAVQLFDTAPETDPKPEVSFFSEPSTTVMEVSDTVMETPEADPSEIAFFGESTDGFIGDAEAITIVPETETSAEDVAPTLVESLMGTVEKSMTLPEVDETTELVQKDASIFDSIHGETATIADAVPEKNDIYAPIRKAISEYDEILVSLSKAAEAKDAENAEYNNRVAEAKAGAKKTLEERKALETEMTRVKQMKELFSSQLA